MAAITEKFGVGGANLTPGGSSGEPTVADALRDVADDLVDMQVATIASADASDLASAITLVNEIKAALNAQAGATIRTTKA